MSRSEYVYTWDSRNGRTYDKYYHRPNSKQSLREEIIDYLLPSTDTIYCDELIMCDDHYYNQLYKEYLEGIANE